ncbi:MAG: hypothetical protein KBS79_04980 [Lachnospiraceae bacterium]|nr:hypothetical protein [Candidatus Minthocola equi]
MVNESRIRLMNRAEMLKQKNKRQIFTAGHFFGGDFVVFQAIKTLIGVTIAYAIVVALIIMVRGEEISTQYSISEIFASIKIILIIYAGVVLAAEIITLFVYISSYWRSNEALAEYRGIIAKLDKQYKKADAIKEEIETDTVPTRIKFN